MQKPIQHLLERKYLPLVLAILITISVSYFSLKSPTPGNDVAFEGQDKLHHFISYFIVMFSYCWVLNNYFKVKSTCLKALIFSLILGTSLEFLQLIPMFKRSFEFLDLMANALGALCAYLIMKKFILIPKE